VYFYVNIYIYIYVTVAKYVNMGGKRDERVSMLYGENALESALIEIFPSLLCC
jgi:hypothetical protein